MNPAAFAAKQKNARRIIDYIVNHGETSRVTLAGALNLSTATVTNIVTELIEQNLIYESRQEHSSVGRKSTLLQFNADLCRMLSVAITNSTSIDLAICNLAGKIEVGTSSPFDCRITETRLEVDVLRGLISLIQDFFHAQDPALQNTVHSIGICIGGMVNTQQIVDMPINNWKSVNLIVPLQAALHMPVYAEGITRILALYEMRFIDHTEKNVLYLNLATGIGLVHFFNGKMVTGKNGIAGEAGHISLNVHGPQCYCGNHGCFEYYCGMHMILNRAAKLLTENNKQDLFYQRVVEKKEPLTPELLFQSREQGSLIVHELLSDASTYLGAGIAALYNIFDPDRMILSGYLSDGDAFLLETATAEAKSRIVNRFSRELRISRSHLGGNQIHLATSAFVLKKLLDQLY